MKRLFASLPLVVAVVVSLTGVAARADEQADALKAKVLDAYKNTKLLHATVDVWIHQKQGRWIEDKRTDVHLGFDREGKRLMLDKAELIVVIDGGKARIKSDKVPGSYAELDFPSDLNHKDLVSTLEFAMRPPIPDVLFLTDPDPLAALNDDKPPVLTYVKPDASGRPGLRFKGTAGVHTLRVDPASGMITSVSIEFSVVDNGGQDGDEAVLTYTTTIKSHNQPLDEKTFAFDTTGLRAATTLKDWVSPGAGQGGEEADALIGNPAPPVELSTLDGKPYKLADDKARIVVLDFWASWCPPCRKGLPLIQNVAAWAAEQKLPVAVYAVNIQETPEQVKAFIEETKLTLPVLMDTEGKVGMAYGCESIPRTAIIVDGKIINIHTGFSPDMEEQIKKEITAALEPVK